MASRVVLIFMLCAVFGYVLCESSGIQFVENLIAKSNNYFRYYNMTEVKIPDSSLLLGTIKLSEGRLGQFDKVELQSEPKVESRNNHYGTVYTYNLRAGLKNLTVDYKFHLNIPFFGKYGNVAITVGKKSFQVEGSVLLKPNGTCIATLHDAKVVEFGDFKIKFEPDNTPFITKIYQAVLNILHQKMITIINHTVHSEISKPSSKEIINQLACAEISPDSTTATPTTNHP